MRTAERIRPGLNPLTIIDLIIAELEITPTQYEEATKSYTSVSQVLAKLHPVWRPSIFPQGSMRAGTTVRPLKDERFDLDMVCQLALSGKTYSPEMVYNLVWDALGEDATYRQMRRKKNRCIRLEYAPGTKYYLDVTPAVPDWAQTDSLYVPDREHQEWCSSNPIKFCDNWFKKIGETLPTILPSKMFQRGGMIEAMAANADIEPMPEYQGFEKTPLQRIVQMVKRDRDEYFQDDANHRPSSILLTTLTAHSYKKEVSTSAEDLLQFVVKVVAKLPDFITVVCDPSAPKYCVANPVNEGENFAESWTDEHHARFRKWHARLITRLQRLQESKGLGIDVMLARLSENFGKERVIRAAEIIGSSTAALQDTAALRITSTGGRSTSVPKTIYFGAK